SRRSSLDPCSPKPARKPHRARAGSRSRPPGGGRPEAGEPRPGPAGLVRDPRSSERPGLCRERAAWEVGLQQASANVRHWDPPTGIKVGAVAARPPRILQQTRCTLGDYAGTYNATKAGRRVRTRRETGRSKVNPPNILKLLDEGVVRGSFVGRMSRMVE